MKDTNASASAFGWDFQINAGIILMLDNIREAKKVKIEGATEDIEIYFEDGTCLFAQAKSAQDPLDNSHAGEALTKAMMTLGAAGRSGKARELVFVTNRPNPFNDITTMQPFSNAYSPVSYDALPPSCQQRIQDICSLKGIDLSTDCFSVLVLNFPENEKTRYQAIKEHIAAFLVEIGDEFQGYSQQVLDKWQLRFGHNATTKDRKRTISKKDMVWSLIVLRCEKINNWLDDYDEGESRKIQAEYGKVISDQSERFTLVAKVLAEYDEYVKKHPNQKGEEIRQSFMAEKSGLFADEFDLAGVDAEVAEAVQRLTIRKILYERYGIKRVKEAVNL